jgi:hypothetical protein
MTYETAVCGGDLRLQQHYLVLDSVFAEEATARGFVVRRIGAQS